MTTLTNALTCHERIMFKEETRYFVIVVLISWFLKSLRFETAETVLFTSIPEDDRI